MKVCAHWFSRNLFKYALLLTLQCVHIVPFIAAYFEYRCYTRRKDLFKRLSSIAFIQRQFYSQEKLVDEWPSCNVIVLYTRSSKCTAQKLFSYALWEMFSCICKVMIFTFSKSLLLPMIEVAYIDLFVYCHVYLCNFSKAKICTLNQFFKSHLKVKIHQ